MKIGIDARLVNATGIGVYTQNLIKADIYDVVLGDEKVLSTYKNYCEDIISYTYPIFGIIEQLFPHKLKSKGDTLDVLHVPHYNIPLLYRGKLIVSIHDLTPIICKQLYSLRHYYYTKFMIGISLRRAHIIFTASECTKKDILHYYPKTNPDKIIVTYNGIDDKFEKRAKEDIRYLYDKFHIPQNKKLFMYVGNLLPHKNITVVLEAFSKLERKEDYRLILVGKAFPKKVDLAMQDKMLGIEQYVIHTGIVEDQELVDLYNLVDVFVFPSLYEGFGLPPLEALKCGTAVLCSNRSCLPEIFGDEVTYFNPQDAIELAQKMSEHTSLGNYENLRKYDWEVTANSIRKALQNLQVHENKS